MFESSAEFKKVEFHEVHVATAALLAHKANWPADLAYAFEQLPDTRTPRFMVFLDRKLVLATTGNRGWNDDAWPFIQKNA